ncbi:hypothetical protein GCK72_007933 [Caenorhabditis remanei]|uniref:Uncharacterized protein n=1 Tax=Caenorhabditis remanei TaxID=31234 RepID=A0A6A5HQ85_CAERE|nr:hypothetical protein GCK72_007933 [Caenorhabditis remanei]KAF1767972.1 hypothetical protein GCK72_007933 [Caenorhabditis remanei]
MKTGGLSDFADFGEEDANCTQGIQWIKDVFTDCVDTDLKLLGFVVGLISLALWLIPLFPQLWQNYKTKKCEGLSLAFLFFWLVGDTCNMLGAILTNQQPIQKIIGVYYIFQDLILWAQYGYYMKIYHRATATSARSNTIVVPVLAVASIGSFVLLDSALPGVETHRIKRSFLESLNHQQGLPLEGILKMWPIFTSYTDMLGYIIGSMAAICYFGGRIPQIIKNYQHRSCEGLSLTMFYIIVAANFTYGVSVLMATTSWLYLLRHLPWLAGSLGCCCFDAVIISQYYLYRPKTPVADDVERTGLLMSQDDSE